MENQTSHSQSNEAENCDSSTTTVSTARRSVTRSTVDCPPDDKPEQPDDEPEQPDDEPEQPNIHEELKEIFRQALQAKSPQERKHLQQKGMAKMLTAPKKYFWQGNPPQYSEDLLYIEAANVAWDYIERKIYGKVRGGKAYDPDDGDRSPIILWNIRCKGEYQDRLERRISLDPDTPDGIEDIEQPPLNVSRLELIRQEIENDPTGELRGAFVRQTPPPPITAQEVLLLIYDRTACGEKWTRAIVAKHFNMPQGTFNAAWRRTLEPLLRKMADRIREMEEF